MRDSWNDAERNPWTTSISLSIYLQITSILHFNDNEDVEGSALDSLHKMCPLLNIVKKTLAYYKILGSKFSFDEGTMAYFSRYAQHLLCYNPMKPTRKFHFKMHVLRCMCCAVQLQISL
jgi:hypothetical protein